MSTQESVSPKRLRCNRCGALSTTEFLSVGSTCREKIYDKEGKAFPCNGEFGLTKGQIFKDRYGYSRTLYRNMRRNGLDINNFSDSINAYKAIRKKRKKQIKTIQRAKHATAAAKRGEKSAVKKKK